MPGTTINITVGQGGAPAPAGAQNAGPAQASSPGTATIIGTLLTLAGGAATPFGSGCGPGTSDGTGGAGGRVMQVNDGHVCGSGGGGSLGGGGGGGVCYQNASSGMVQAIFPGKMGAAGLIGQGGDPGYGLFTSFGSAYQFARMVGKGGSSPFGAGKPGIDTEDASNARAGGDGGPGGGGGGGGGASGASYYPAGGGKGGDGLVIFEF